jgi:tetratricopeptide (TPR) repeat protein
MKPAMFDHNKFLWMQEKEITRIEKLLAFIERNPADSFSRHALAMEYVKLGDDPAARSALETLLDKDPSYVGSYYHLGKIWERAGDLLMAADTYRKGILMAEKAGDRHATNELRAALLSCED